MCTQHRASTRFFLFTAIVVLPLVLNAQDIKQTAAKTYRDFIVGNPDDVQRTTKPGFVLMGGGTDVDEAFRWLIERSGGGDIVVIRASATQ